MMLAAVYRAFFLFILIVPFAGNAELYVGIGKSDMTPQNGTPSAGYAQRQGKGMEGVHDSLMAIALFIDNGEKNIVLCSVDHLGFTYDMVQNITKEVQSYPGLSRCEVYIASSHTHSGGGAYLDIPILGPMLAGTYDPQLTKFYEEQTVNVIIEASQCRVPAYIGIGYGQAENLSRYRGLWPEGIKTLSDVAIIKVTKDDGSPLAVLFNYPVHPTVLTSENRLFSADFVGYARDHIQALLGSDIQPIYFNGAQGDILPVVTNEVNRFEACHDLGASLAKTVEKIWLETDVSSTFTINSQKETYHFKPQETPQGLILPVDSYASEMNILVFNQRHAFVTIPGELSCIYDRRLKEIGKEMGYQQVSIFGLVNDAHGYMILPESWKHKTFESNLSFGGENYGDAIEERAVRLLLRFFSQDLRINE